MMLAGFEHPTAGTILLDGQPINDLPPHCRNTGVVFQSYALFPHMTVGEKIAFSLQMRDTDRAEIAEQVLDMVQLSALADRRPSQLSGSQKQLVALAPARSPSNPGRADGRTAGRARQAAARTDVARHPRPAQPAAGADHRLRHP